MMKDVPPGDETGIYYILVSGLPFGTIWQLLKDWLREGGCQVDHIEIFQKSTSGWIRLIGKDNFELALERLRCVPYNNRVVIFMDRNRTESVKVMQLLDDPPPEPRLPRVSHETKARSNKEGGHEKRQRGYQQNRFRSTAGRATQPSSTAETVPSSSRCAAQERKSMTAARGPGSGKAPRRPTKWPCSNKTQQGSVNTHGDDGPSQSLARKHAGKKQCRGAGESSCLLQLGSLSLGDNEAPLDKAQASRLPSPPDSEQQAGEQGHRVLLLSLKHGATPEHVQDWVRARLGQWTRAVSAIDVPVDHHKGRIRGQGYVTFADANAAASGAELLDQKPLMGRLVHARLMGSSNKGKKKMVDKPNKGLPVQDEAKPAMASPPACEAAPQREEKYPRPVIVNGSNFRLK
ncbi:hypothetical protein CDD81_5670 [Ophiocordyceps australis]|uniref:RRM domain-containing protein n=1 Tax=Ophiocordyceps australis TaxID=1399860 RepID=A0A2C5XI85_9HYPO|nr:hypothetical protein CDD81_5670 [Ophiocordyceps australis]